MSNQERLLSDEELGNEIINRFISVADIHKQEELFSFINTQKRLYAESVIGKDEADYTMMPDIHRPEEPMQVPNYDAQLRNQLRAEQRARIQ